MRPLTSESLVGNRYIDAMNSAQCFQLNRVSVAGEFDEIGRRIALATGEGSGIQTFTSNPEDRVKGRIALGGVTLFDSRRLFAPDSLMKSLASVGLRDMLLSVVESIPALSEPVTASIGTIYTEAITHSKGHNQGSRSKPTVVRAELIGQGNDLLME